MNWRKEAQASRFGWWKPMDNLDLIVGEAQRGFADTSDSTPWNRSKPVTWAKGGRITRLLEGWEAPPRKKAAGAAIQPRQGSC